ncbi:MAG: copper chaperone PCu(A)C [Robiginitomaculum sp.]|nr:copper chaperone PCu(A)C [Robiginitomaculum sp.]
MIRKVLIYPALVLFALLGSVTAYYLTGDKQNLQPVIRVANVAFRLPAPGQTTAAAYFDIINKGGADALLSATSSASPRVELHTHLHEDGVMKMRQVDSVKILAQQTTQFKSGGLHVMLFDFAMPQNTTSIPLTLTFARSGEKRVVAIIGDSHSEMDHSKMNHEDMGH